MSKSCKETISCCKLHWFSNHSLSYDVCKGFHQKVIFPIDKKVLLVSILTKNSWLQFLNDKGYESLLLEKIIVVNIFELQRISISISSITFLIDKGYSKFWLTKDILNFNWQDFRATMESSFTFIAGVTFRKYFMSSMDTNSFKAFVWNWGLTVNLVKVFTQMKFPLI